MFKTLKQIFNKIFFKKMDFDVFKKDSAFRLELFIKSKNYDKKEFAKLIGVNENALYPVVSGRNAMSFELIYKIIVKFPDFDFNWLFTGRESLPRDNAGNVVVGENNGVMQVNNSMDVLLERVRSLEEQLKLKDQIIELLKISKP